jgi:intein/homing endonuclease
MTPINGEDIIKFLEVIGRVSWKSEDRITEDSAKVFIDKITKAEHESVLEHFNITVRYICDRGRCYDDQTKVLTEDGWKYFKDVDISKDLFYSLDPLNNLVKLNANKLISQDYNGEMHRWKSTMVDLLVTPNHNMWLYDYNKRAPFSKVWKFIESKDATNGRYKFLRADKPIERKGFDIYTIPEVDISRGFYIKKYPAVSFDANLFFELLGWWITDGSISYGKGTSGNRIVISQTKLIGRERIEILLNLLNINFTKYDNEFRISSPQLFKWLVSNFIKESNTRKTYYCFIPRWMLIELSKNNLQSFLDGIIGGDGTPHAGGKGYQIYTASEQFANDLVEMCLLLGKSANIYKIDGRQRIFPNGVSSNCKEQFVVSIVSTNEHLFNVNEQSKFSEQYNGKVYCVELPEYHKLYVMRNGKPCWCGNSHELVRHRIASYTQESTRYCNYSKGKFGGEITVIKPIFWEEGSDQYTVWKDTCEYAEENYNWLLRNGATAQEARSVLPNSLKTEIVSTMNLREWRHFFKLRTDKSAHPQMRELTIPILADFKKMIPVIFDNILPEGRN